MKCPKCHAPMDKAHMADVEIDRCVGCKGLWFDHGELDALCAAPHAEMLDLGLPSLGAAFDKDEPVMCPKCDDVVMQRVTDDDQIHIVYERCPKCNGEFLDAGEFTDLKENTLSDVFKIMWAKIRR